jgi:nitrate reductase assembly molybdenum cofactor insertion protein NarJ
MDPAALLNEASEWRLFGLLFEYPAPAWRSNLQALLPALHRPELRDMAEAALAQSSEGLHFALFGPAGTVPVREVTYQGGVQFGYLMAELQAYYDAFAYEPQVEEAADHLAVQLGFVSFLRMKQAVALMDGDSDRAQIAAEAAGAFIKDHLAVQAEPVLHRLENFGPDYLIAAARLILERTGPSPRSAYPLGDGDDSETMSCGDAPAADDLIQLQP